MEYQSPEIECPPPRRGNAGQSPGEFARPVVFALLILVTLLKPVSNLSMAFGMKHFPQTLSLNPLPYLVAMLDPFVVLGIAMQILWLLTRMSLLSVADLSFVLPVTSAGYVISTLLGWRFLHESVSASRWAGAVLISLGAALVAGTPKKTAGAKSGEKSDAARGVSS
jgi:drug/metabolite transporter (DMT)-like permease